MTRPPPDVERAPSDEFDELMNEIITKAESLKARYIRLMVLAALGFVAFFALGFAWGMQARAEPVTGLIYVIDGDTVRLSSGEKLRILNIDAPETSRARCEAEAALGYKAKERLARLLRGAVVTLERCDGKRCTDPYGRTLARVFANGQDVGEALISEGLATRWPQRFDGCGFRRVE